MTVFTILMDILKRWILLELKKKSGKNDKYFSPQMCEWLSCKCWSEGIPGASIVRWGANIQGTPYGVWLCATHCKAQQIFEGKESEGAQSCPTLCDPMDNSLPGSSVHGIFQARVPEWGAIAFSDSSANAPQIAAVKESGDLKTVKVNNGDRADFSWKSA